MNIDWSKAPDGATHARNCGWEHPDWYKIVDGVLLVHSCGEGWDESGYSDMGEIPNLHIRPSTEWTGTGLPPVGTVCEVLTIEPLWGDNGWVKATVLHADEGALFVKYGFGYSVEVDPEKFRPIRTQEQIEAEEREKALSHFAYVLYRDVGMDRRDAELLWNKGYRKQQKEDA